MPRTFWPLLTLLINAALWATPAESHCAGKHQDNHPHCPGGGGGGETDTTPPGPIEDELRTQSHTYDGMVLHWIAPGDDGANDGTVDHYDIRRTDPVEGAACVASPETRVTDEDRGFVLNNINRYLKKQLTREDIISERCGVRPLVVDRTPSDDTEWTQLSRKHVLEVDRKRRHLTIFGGKLTDCLNVGEEVCDEVARLGLKGTRSLKRWFGEPSRISRRRFLDRFGNTPVLVIGSHFDTPTAGRIARDGDAYRLDS